MARFPMLRDGAMQQFDMPKIKELDSNFFVSLNSSSVPYDSSLELNFEDPIARRTRYGITDATQDGGVVTLGGSGVVYNASINQNITGLVIQNPSQKSLIYAFFEAQSPGLTVDFNDPAFLFEGGVALPELSGGIDLFCFTVFGEQFLVSYKTNFLPAP